MNMKDVIEKYNINTASSNSLEESVLGINRQDLLKIVNDSHFNNDSHINATTARYALIEAIENDSNTINNSHLQAAVKRVNRLNKEVKVPDTVIKAEVQTNQIPSQQQSKKPNAFQLVSELVRKHPNMKKKETVKMIIENIPDISQMTAVQYYYRCRKNLSLDTNGKRGRPKSDKFSKIKALVRKLLKTDMSVSDRKLKISQEYGLTLKSAAVYYYKAKKEIERE